MLVQDNFQRKETKVCLIIWISVVLYAIYQFAVASQKYFEVYYDHYEDFAKGWSILSSRKKDKADFEWETISFYFQTVYPVIVCYVVASEASRFLLGNINVKFQQCFQTLFPIIYLTYSMGYRVTLIVLLQPLLFLLVSVFQRKPFVWICSLVCLTLITIYKKVCVMDEFLIYLGVNHFEAYLNVLLLCWMNLKCTSFFLNANSQRSSLDYLSYCFYFPTLFTGPFIDFKDFKKLYAVNSFKSLDARLRTLGLNILRCVFWMVFVNFWLHFIYVNATSFQLELVQKLDLCSLCGYGYLMGQFFHIKYLVLYGLSTSLAFFNNIPVPSLPRCIGRVHLYSDMWKYFDPGLYSFLKTCVFVPSLKLGVKKFVASLLCFLFVFVWHGIEKYILIWAMLNFMGIILEDAANTFYVERLKFAGFVKTIKRDNLRRLKCMLAAPLLGMSAVSNFYFFAGQEVGDIFVQKSLSEPNFNKVLVLFVLYCCCEISTEVRHINTYTI